MFHANINAGREISAVINGKKKRENLFEFAYHSHPSSTTTTTSFILTLCMLLQNFMGNEKSFLFTYPYFTLLYFMIDEEIG